MNAHRPIHKPWNNILWKITSSDASQWWSSCQREIMTFQKLFYNAKALEIIAMTFQHKRCSGSAWVKDTTGKARNWRLLAGGSWLCLTQLPEWPSNNSSSFTVSALFWHRNIPSSLALFHKKLFDLRLHISARPGLFLLPQHDTFLTSFCQCWCWHCSEELIKIQVWVTSNCPKQP